MEAFTPCPKCGSNVNTFYYTKTVMFERNKWHIAKCFMCGHEVIGASKEQVIKKWETERRKNMKCGECTHAYAVEVIREILDEFPAWEALDKIQDFLSGEATVEECLKPEAPMFP